MLVSRSGCMPTAFTNIWVLGPHVPSVGRHYIHMGNTENTHAREALSLLLRLLFVELRIENVQNRCKTSKKTNKGRTMPLPLKLARRLPTKNSLSEP